MAQTTKQYFKDYFEESDSIQDVFEVTDSKGTLHIFDKDQVLAEILAMPLQTQKQIRNKFIYIDFKRGNMNHLIKYLLKGLVG